MPLTKIEKINSNSFWCLWEISESFEQLKNKVTLSEYGLRELDEITHPTKKLERLASRACIQELVKNTGSKYHGIYKDDNDKPHLLESNYYISISHCYPYAAAILHKKLPVGIDVEMPSEKIGRIAHRFLNESEFEDCDGDLKKLCIYWGGKEAIYKLNGKMGLNFKKDIRIYPFELHKRDVIRSEFSLNENRVRIALNYFEIKSHIICYCF